MYVPDVPLSQLLLLLPRSQKGDWLLSLHNYWFSYTCLYSLLVLVLVVIPTLQKTTVV